MAVAVDATGDVFVTGYGYNAPFQTIKYSTDGVGLWTNTYSAGSYGESIAVDASGKAVVAGRGPSGWMTV